MSTLNNIQRSRIFKFSTTVEMAKDAHLITDGEIDSTSSRYMKPSATSRSKVLYPIERCTYVVYTDGRQIFIEARDGADEGEIAKAVMELSERIKKSGY